MWNCNYEAIKTCFIHSRTLLASQRILKLKYNIYKAELRFYFCRNYLNMFFPENKKFQSVRKLQSETRTQKLIFKPVREKKGKELSHSCIIESLQNCKSIEEQIEVFHSMVKLPPDDVEVRQSICKDLEKALQSYFPSTVAVHLIGSSINGFGFKGCDVDLSLHFLTANEHVEEEKSLSDKEEKGQVTKVYRAKSQLLTVRKILQEAKFEEPLTVIPGRCPILNFSHQNLACDLSVNNRLALHSTNLMLLCGKLDGRVTPLLQVIVYWAKNCKLVGGPGKFKTYAIFLLVIYFLQTRSPSILPSIETMLEKTEFSKNLHNWSYDVTEYLSEFDRSSNRQTVGELLREFFTYYGNYDFSHIICPLVGHSFERKHFLEKIGHDDSFVLNTVCIQDPLNPSWNVTTGANWKHCKNFLKAVVVAWERCRDREWGLTELLDHAYDPDPLFDVRQFDVRLDLERHAPERAAERVRSILSHCLDFGCYPFESSNDLLPRCLRDAVERQPPPEAEAGVRLLSRHAFEANDSWLGRNSYSSGAPSEEDPFERERKISQSMKLQRANREGEPFYFLCQCYCEGGGRLRVRFRPLNADKFIPKLVIFLREYVPRMMREK